MYAVAIRLPSDDLSLSASGHLLSSSPGNNTNLRAATYMPKHKISAWDTNGTNVNELTAVTFFVAEMQSF